MVNVKASMLILVTCAMSAACAVRAAGPQSAPPPSQQTLATKIVAWGQRDTAPLVVPAQAKHVQLIFTSGWAEDEHYAWLVSDGADVVAVYHCTTNQRSEILEAANRAFLAAATFSDKRSWVILGSIKPPPPPPPPGPGGKPGDPLAQLPRPYLQVVLQAAWNINAEQAQLGGTAAVH